MSQTGSDFADLIGLFAAIEMGAEQPGRRSFGIDSIDIGSIRTPVQQTDVLHKPFCVLTHLAKDFAQTQKPVLIIPPLSGHFPFLLNDLIINLLPDHDVYVADWINARYVSRDSGPFGFQECIRYIMEFVQHLAEDVVVIALCQATVPSLAATALLSQTAQDAVPSALVLIAGPIDPLANSTRITRLIRSHSLSWYRNFTLSRVPHDYPGGGRLVYPAAMQLSGLLAYLKRHMEVHGELYHKITADDGVEPEKHPFHEAYSALMDIPAGVFLDTIRSVFLERALPRHTLKWNGLPVDCRAITKPALMTIEGELDDVAAPGQTSAAHSLCSNIASEDRVSLVVGGCGHFSTFHGHHLKAEILPALCRFMARQ